MADRRQFLRGLAALPMVGGSSVRADAPVTDALLRRYVTFIAREHAMALREHEERRAPHRFAPGQPPWNPPMFWVPDIDIGMQVAIESAPPSTRAASVLSAIGVPLVGGAL